MQRKPRRLVLSYSRTGHTARLAEEIAALLGAPSATITCSRYGPGRLSFVLAGFDSLRRARPAIEHPPFDPMTVDMLVIGSPIWTERLATPILRFLEDTPILPDRIGVFVTCGDRTLAKNGAESIVASVLREPPVGLMGVANIDEDTPEAHRRVRSFCALMRAHDPWQPMAE